MKNYGQKTGENSCFSCVCQKFFVPLRHKRKRKEKVMPIIIPVTVDIPATKTISYEFLRDELTRYAQNVVDSKEEPQLPLITEEELKNCMPLDEAMNKLRAHIHERYQSQVKA